MKRNILSIMLACLMIVSLLVLTGCKVDDLAVKVDENAANAENAVNNAASKADADVKAAAKKAADDLAAAQAKLEKLIKDGDAADTASLAAAVKDFNAAIAAIDEALTGADAALKAELVADFDEKIETATKMLQEATNTAIGKATEELEAAIAKGDAATAAQLSDAIAAVAGKLANLDAVVQETAIALDDLLKAELSAAIEAVADAAAKNLADAKAALTEAITAGDAKVVADLTAAIEAAAEAAALADDALKAELTAAIESAVAALETKLTAALDTAKADLNAAIATKAEAEDLAAAIVEYKALVAAAESAAKAAAVADNEALETKLTKLVNDSVAALEASIKTVADDLADATAALNALIKTNADDITALEASRDALNDDVAALQAALDALSGDTEADFSSLTTYIDEQLADAVAALTAATIQLKDWNEAGDAVAEAIINGLNNVEAKYWKVAYRNGVLSSRDENGNIYYEYSNGGRYYYMSIQQYRYITAPNQFNFIDMDGNQKWVTIVPEVYTVDFNELRNEYQYKLNRATSIDNVAEILAAYDAELDAIVTTEEYLYDVLLELVGDEYAENPADAILHNAEWQYQMEKARRIVNSYGLRTIRNINNRVIAEDGKSFTNESIEYNKSYYEEVVALFDEMWAKYQSLFQAEIEANAINARVETFIADLAADGYTAANKAEYEDILAEIATWDETYGAANAALIDREKVETMKTDYAAAVKAYEDAAKALLDKFAIYNAAEYVFVYNTDYTAVTELKAAYDAWALDVVARGWALDGAVEAPVVTAHTVFEPDTLARAIALNTANDEATAIENAIKALTTELNNFTVVRSAYQVALENIKADAKAWIDTYFAAPYDAIDAAEKANYELLDHAAVVAVEELYNKQMAEVMELAEALKAALAKLDTINVFSGTDIEAAQAAYTAFTNWLADLEYEIEGLADTATITNTLATKTVEFKNIAAQVIADYKLLAVLKAADVKLTSEADVEDLKTWFKDYFTVDLTVADSALPVAEVVLDDGTDKLTVNATTVADAKAAVKAFADLTAAKAEELAALKAELEALVAKTPATDLRAAVDAALANYAEWLDGSNVPAGFDKTQFIPVDPTVLDTLKADLDALNVAVKALEDAYKALQDRIALLVVDYKLIADTAAAQATLDALNADIKAFILSNNDVDCFTEAEKKTLADAQTAIDQAVALAELLEDYNNLIASLAGIADTRVADSIKARADAAKAAAEEAVKANDEDAIDLAYANFELFAHTVTEYNAAIVAAGADATKAAKVYEAYVLLDAREDMVSADQLADEKVIVTDTFTAVLA